MTEQHFGAEMNRLANQFGKASYSSERAKIIWREVRDLPDGWMTKVVDEFLGSCRQAPLLPDFRDRISAERERMWIEQKKHHAQDAQQFAHLIIESGEHQLVCEFILKRMNGGVNDEEWNGFMASLKAMGGGR